MSKGGTFRPRVIDRVIFATFALLNILGGVYLVSPFYIDSIDTIKSPLFALFENHEGVAEFGALLLLDGLLLLYVSIAGSNKLNTVILNNSLLAGFLLRLYALFGVLLTLESWRPPSYLSQFALVSILGAEWVWVKINERLTE